MALELDFGVDIAGVLAEFTAEIRAGREDQKTILSKLLALEQRYQQEGPIYVPIGGNATSTATGATFAIDLGGPSYGRRWELRQLIIGGNYYSSLVGGSAEVVQTPSLALVGTTEPSLSSLEDRAPSLPAISFYSAGQIIVRHPNRLFVVVVSPTVSTNYTVGGEAIETPDAGSRQVVTT